MSEVALVRLIYVLSISRGRMLRLTALGMLAFLVACTSEPAVEKPAVYVSSCEPCHGNGAGGAPITGDKEEWALRLAKGREAVYQLALVGFEGENKTVMPAKGARKDLPDEEIISLVDYMIQVSQ
jgi:cytochrome c5